MPGLQRVAVNVVEGVRSNSAVAPPPYLGLMEYWFESEPGEVAGALSAVWRKLGWLGSRWLYRVSERIQLDTAESRVGLSATGVKAFYLVTRPAGLSNDDATRGWRDHAGAARKHHVGTGRYVQNGVIQAITPGAPLVHGFAELSFPTLDDFERRMFDNDEGRAAITREASALAGEVITLVTRERLFVAQGAPW